MQERAGRKRLGGEQDEEEMEVVLQRGAVHVGEDVARDHRKREQDRDRHHGRAREHRERGAHHLADPLALAASVGIGDESGHPRLQAEVGDAEEAGRQRKGQG